MPFRVLRADAELCGRDGKRCPLQVDREGRTLWVSPTCYPDAVPAMVQIALDRMRERAPAEEDDDDEGEEWKRRAA